MILCVAAILGITPFYTQAQTLKDAASEIAGYLDQTDLELTDGGQMIIEAANHHTRERDIQAVEVENQLQSSLTRRFPALKIIIQDKSLVGISLNNTIFVKITYERKGRVTLLRLQAVKGLNGRMVARTEAVFESGELVGRALVAVLDIESSTLGVEEKKAFSNVFRTALSEIDAFDLVAGAAIDKMDPEAIQRSAGCTRDECAVIIGEQLGVDRVISISLDTLDKNDSFVSADMVSVKDGSVIASRSVRHTADLKTLPDSLYILAAQISGKIKESDSKAAEKEVLSRKVTYLDLSGPRFGFTYLPTGLIDRIYEESEGEVELGPVMTQAGWQWERRIMTVEGGVTFLTSLIGLLGGVDQNTIIPSLTGVLGVRTPGNFEFHVGPNVTPMGTAFTYVAGMNLVLGNMNVPINLAAIPSKGGIRVSLLVGFNWRD